MQPVLPSMGFVGLIVAMMVTGGAVIAMESGVLIAAIFLMGGLWMQRFLDRQDLLCQAQATASASTNTFATPAAWLLPGNRPVQKGELQLTSHGLSWLPGRSSQQKRFDLAWSDTKGVGIATRGVVFRRGVIVVARSGEPLLFTTAARTVRVLDGIERLGVPAAAS
jgi:hypothetical protein